MHTTEMNDDLITKLENRYPDDKIFYAWECVSVITKLASLDLVFKDNNSLMAFIHIAHFNSYSPKSAEFLYVYKLQNFKIKVSYEAWKHRCSINAHIRNAIALTLQ